MVGPGVLEPPTPALSTRCSNQLSYEPKFLKKFDWWSRSGSNRRPPECKSGALPTELRPQKKHPNRLFDRTGYKQRTNVLQKLFCVIYINGSSNLVSCKQDTIDLINQKVNLAP